MTKFYKFGNPRSKRYASDGALINITITDVGGETGVFATDNPGLQRELDLMVGRGEQAVWEIQAAEYHNLKKNRTSPQVWREELSGRGLERNKAQVVAVPSAPPPQAPSAAAAAVKPAAIVPAAPVAERPIATKRK